MKKYIRAHYAYKKVPKGNFYGCHLRSNSGSIDDILVFSQNRGAAIAYGEYVSDLFRKASPAERRSDDESDQLVDDIYNYIPKGVYTADDFFSPYSFYMDETGFIVNDIDGHTFTVIPARIIRGNYRI